MTVMISEKRLIEEGRSNKKIKKEASLQMEDVKKKKDCDHGRGGNDHNVDDNNNDEKDNSWSELLPEMVITIIERISFLDRRNAMFAFPEWSSTISTMPNRPFLLSVYPGPLELTIVDPIDKSRFVLEPTVLPHEVFIRSTKHGWVLIYNHDLSLFSFYNPLSQAIIELPPTEKQLWGSFCFSTSPTSPECMVFVIEFWESPLRIIFCRRGDKKWRELYFSQEKKSFGFEDGNAVYFQGKVYRMATDGRLGVFDPTTESWFVHDSPNAGVSRALDEINYLVESDNTLFRVWIRICLDYRFVRDICVFKMDHSGHNWVKTRSLGGRCFFVSYDPVDVEVAEEFGEEKDMIYFAGETRILGSFIRYDVRHAHMLFPEGEFITGTFFQNSCWILSKPHHLSPGEEHWF